MRVRLATMFAVAAGFHAFDPFASAAPPADSFDAKALEAFLAPVVEPLRRREHVPGVVVAIVRGGAIVARAGFGHADAERKIPMDADATRMRIGSISKALTAVALARQADAGRLDLAADVNRYLRELRVPDAFGAPINATHLLTHTGGFDQPGLNRNFDRPEDRPALADFLRRDLRRVRPPGVLTCYDTYGISLAGELLASLCSADYAEAMRRELFEPLGMASTSIETPSALRSRLARGYSLDGSKFVEQPYEYYASLPASSVDSTAADMARLMLWLLPDSAAPGGAPFGPSGAGRWSRISFRLHERLPGFCCGFWERDARGQRVLEHGGTMRGYSAQLWLLPEHRLGVFVAANRDTETGPPTMLCRTVVDRLMERWFPDADEPPATAAATSQPTEIAAPDTTRFAGLYVENLFCHTCPEGEGWPVSDEPLRIESVGPGRIRTPHREYHAIAPLLFADPSGSVLLAFVEDRNGRIRGLASNLDAPGTTHERLDDALLDEVAGKGWKDQPPAPLVAATHRLHGRWKEAAAAYLELARNYPPPRMAWIAAQYHAGSCLVRANAPAEALAPIQAARAALLRLSEEADGMRRDTLRGYLARAMLFESAAECGAGNLDAAFDLFEDILKRKLLDPAELFEIAGENPMLSAMARDPRLAALRRAHGR